MSLKMLKILRDPFMENDLVWGYVVEFPWKNTMQTWQELTIDNIGNYVKRLFHDHWVPNVVINYLDHPGKY